MSRNYREVPNGKVLLNLDIVIDIEKQKKSMDNLMVIALQNLIEVIQRKELKEYGEITAGEYYEILYECFTEGDPLQ